MTRREHLKLCINKTKINILDEWNGEVRVQLCKRIYLFAEQLRNDVISGRKKGIRKEEQSLAKFQHEIFKM